VTSPAHLLAWFTKPTHGFTLYLDGTRELRGEDLDRLYDAGCHDAHFGRAGGHQLARFRRHAPTMTAAVDAAISEVESVVPGMLSGVMLEQPGRRALDKPLAIGERVFAGLTDMVFGGYSARPSLSSRLTPHSKLQGLASEVTPWHGYEVLEDGLNQRLSQRARASSPAREKQLS
jgi:hypothetical protein